MWWKSGFAWLSFLVLFFRLIVCLSSFHLTTKKKKKQQSVILDWLVPMKTSTIPILNRQFPFDGLLLKCSNNRAWPSRAMCSVLECACGKSFQKEQVTCFFFCLIFFHCSCSEHTLCLFDLFFQSALDWKRKQPSHAGCFTRGETSKTWKLSQWSCTR